MLHKALRICSVLLLAALVTEGTPLGSDYKYYSEVASWFKLHIMPTNWTEARLRCAHEGAVLASPLNAQLRNAMMDVMGDQVYCGVFSGIHATISKGDYFSLEGVPLSEIPVVWAPNEPDNFENSESCLLMLANGTMADVKCTEVFPYVCYKKHVDIVDSGYQLNSRTGSCYKFHSKGQTWSEAYMTCADEGGYLAIINSELEFQVIKEIYSKFPNNVISSVFPDSLFIGLNDWGNHNIWRTVHGETLQEAGFDKWGAGEPNNLGGNEHCGVMFREGLLNDCTCDRKLAFICEKSPTCNTVCSDNA